MSTKLTIPISEIERMETSTTNQLLPSVKPDVISYRLVLTALEHSTDHDKAERAMSVLQRFLASQTLKIQKNGFKLSILLANSHTHCCASPSVDDCHY